ncbi:hypothetical protein H5410_021203 [Solanum commersonii]|uniref:Uncharacterized protein n=1 Tax=Solanum commersonii TaxID=4109 RepID=A0A9J5ZBA0_SOLCO|nr:hypothetical protein H5410_021203 [Solanum commersonii]
MASLAVLVMHSGRWDSDNYYVDYTIKGEIFKESSLYKELYNVIAMQLGVDMNVIKLKIEYKVEESNTPMLIHNDMGVREKGIVRSICIDGIAEFDTRQMTIAELIESLCVLGLGSCDGVISDPCNKYVEDKVYSQKHSTSMLIGGIVKPKFVDHKRKYTPSDIQSDVKIYLGVDVNYSLPWRAKEKALISLRGTISASYNKLHAYLYMMNITYPGSHIRLKKTDKNEFLYLFVALNSFIQGFDHCRPIIVVDGSYLRGQYNRTFVATSTMDGAGMFQEVYGERSKMCVVSNRNESIIKAVTRVYNNVSHYACMWNLWGNVEKKFRKSSKELSLVFYTMAKTCNKLEFDRLLDTVEKVDVGVKEYLELAGYDKWSRCTHRGWAMTSNIAESINIMPSTEYIHNVTDDYRSFVWKSLVADGYCSNLYKSMTVLKIYEIPIYPLSDVVEWVIPEYIMYDEDRPPKVKRPPERSKKKPRTKITRELLGLKGSIHVAHVELQVTIGVHVETGLKKFNELFRLYWSVILDFIDT